MAKRIVWSKRGIKRFNDIADYLDSEWGTVIAQDFATKTYGILYTLSNYPNLGTVENKEKEIRGFPISKHNRLFYRCTENDLIVLNIFDERQHPNKRLY
jgi:plasmid stabilization system protein ParE